MKAFFVSPRLRFLVVVSVIWIAVLLLVEFAFIGRAGLNVQAGAKIATPASQGPDFNLKNAVFACAMANGFATSVLVKAEKVVVAKCEASLTEATTRCPSNFPVAGFGDTIRCADGEAIHCQDGPLQTLGLFKDDSFCGDITDRDPGPPQEAPRSDD